eukprot:gene9435-6618_t
MPFLLSIAPQRFSLLPPFIQRSTKTLAAAPVRLARIFFSFFFLYMCSAPEAAVIDYNYNMWERAVKRILK